MEPVINVGPDADKFRDPATGQIKDASDLGLKLSTFTAHRSPLARFRHGGRHGFAVSKPRVHGELYARRSQRQQCGGPFFDASQDLVDLQLTNWRTNYQARVTKLVSVLPRHRRRDHRQQDLRSRVQRQPRVWEITFPKTPSSVMVLIRQSAAEHLSLRSHEPFPDLSTRSRLQQSC